MGFPRLGGTAIRCWSTKAPSELFYGPLLLISQRGFAGQQFDAMLHVSKILATTKNITIIDGYISEDVLSLLSSKDKSVIVKILTKPLASSLLPMAQAFNGGLSIRSCQSFHDRFLIIDDNEFHHFGASIKDVGKKGFMFSRIEEPEVIQALRGKL